MPPASGRPRPAISSPATTPIHPPTNPPSPTTPPMSTTSNAPHSIQPHHLVGELATTFPGASRVFYRLGLDFCCGGQIRLDDACAKHDLDVDELCRTIEAEAKEALPTIDWSQRPVTELVDFILERFHAPHRDELPRMIAMAQKVEDVHGAKPTCPRGLAAHLRHMQRELEEHMQKEEQILFPLLQAGEGRMAMGPVTVMEQEHQDHGKNLEELCRLTDDFTPPAEACGTWSALYLSLDELRRELMEHISLENNVLFPRALQG